MTLYRRGRVWHYEFRIRGKRYRGSTGHTRKSHARDFEASERARAIEGAVLAPSMKLSRWIPRYLDWVDQQGKRSSSRIREHLEHVERFLGDDRLSRITPERMEFYQQQRLAETAKHTGRPPAHSTVNKETQALHGALARAVAQRILPRNPAAGYKRLREKDAEGRVITPAELAKLLEKAPEWLRPAIELSYETAMRRSEIVSLTWARVDLRKRRIYIPASATKTDAGRAVPLSERALEILRAMPRQIDGGRLFDRTGSATTTAFRRAVAAAGLEGVRFHDLRHTCITRWYEAGHPERLIMKASGHKTPAIFARYVHLSDRSLGQLTGEPTDSTTDREPAREKTTKTGA